MAPVSSREISSTAPRMVSTDSSAESMLRTMALLSGLAHPLHQRGGIEPGGIERLQDIVAGGREEAGLADIGFVGAARASASSWLTRVSSAVRSATRCSSVSLACFRARSAATRWVMSVKVATMPLSGMALERTSMMRSPPPRTSAKGLSRVRKCRTVWLTSPAGNIAALAEDCHDVRQREAHLAGVFRQVEQLPEAAVPDRQVVRAVEDGDALVHLRKRRLQHVLVILQRLARLVEQPSGIGGGILDLLQDQRQHEPADDEPMALPSNCSVKWISAMSAGWSSSSLRPEFCW